MNITIYLTTENSKRIAEENNKSGLINELLNTHYKHSHKYTDTYKDAPTITTIDLDEEEEAAPRLTPLEKKLEDLLFKHPDAPLAIVGNDIVNTDNGSVAA